jgi:hypothetical protein
MVLGALGAAAILFVLCLLALWAFIKKLGYEMKS